MQTGMHFYPQGLSGVEEGEIPVDNMEFSTLSTDFSTGLIHSPAVLWIYSGDLHKKKFTLSTYFPFFRTLVFLPQEFFCAKIRT